MLHVHPCCRSLCLVGGLLLVSFLGGRVSAQQVQITAGAAVSFPFVKGLTASYQPAVLPQAQVYYFRPFTDRLSFKTGIGYEQKGWQTEQVYHGENGYREEYGSRVRYHFLTVPLQLSYRVREWGQNRLYLSGGMNYGLLAKARYTLRQEAFRGEEKLSSGTYEVKLPIKLDPSSIPYSNVPHHSSLHLFNPAVRAEVTWQWRQRYIFSAFYERNLTDVNGSPYKNGRLYLQYCGLSAGISL